MPLRCSRRHSTYIDSMERTDAIRSAAWSDAPQISHHSLMSASDGVARACSIREHFDSCHPACRASALAVRPASSLISSSRLARACYARWALDDGEVGTERLSVDRSWDLVFVVRDCALPHRLERGGAQLHQGSILGEFVLQGLAISAEVV